MHIKPSSSSASSSKNDHDQLLTEMKKNRSKTQGCVCSVYAEKSSRHTVTVKICMSLCTCSTLSVHRHCMHFFVWKSFRSLYNQKICTLHLVTFIFESFEAFKKTPHELAREEGVIMILMRLKCQLLLESVIFLLNLIEYVMQNVKKPDFSELLLTPVNYDVTWSSKVNPDGMHNK